MRTQAIIIKKIPLREHDELIVSYTNEQGKQVYHAKSSVLTRSKQGRHLDIMNLVEFSLISGNGHPIITSAHCLDAFRGMKSNLRAMSVALFINECVSKLVFEGEPDSKLWDFLADSFEQLDAMALRKNIDWKLTREKMQGRLLSILGYDENTLLSELHPSTFHSLQFHRKVLSW